MCQLHSLKPAKHELQHLTSIRATVLACQMPLNDFLAKISKFEGKMGTSQGASHRFSSLPRRVQFKVLFKEDIKQLRSTMASHVCTINNLLLQQIVALISLAEADRDQAALNQESEILVNRQLLEEARRQLETCMTYQHAPLDKLGTRTDKICEQLDQQESSVEAIRSTSDMTYGQTTSILAKVTGVLSYAASSHIRLLRIGEQLQMIMRLCVSFTSQVRGGMTRLGELLLNLQDMLQQIDCKLPANLYPPFLQFTTALGETMALPYQLCQSWSTFTDLLSVRFTDKPGKRRVDMGKYVIMHARGGRLLKAESWEHAVKQDDHLTMSIVLDDRAALAKGNCPFPTCQASIQDVEVKDGGRTCPACGRWSFQTDKLDILSEVAVVSSTVGSKRKRMSAYEQDTHEPEPKKQRALEEEEDIEIYRKIHVCRAAIPTNQLFVSNMRSLVIRLASAVRT